jgi:hypothetical protein
MVEDKSEQGSEGWRKAHLGIPTASDFSDVMPTPSMYRTAEKKKQSVAMPASRDHYKHKKLVERLLGVPWDIADGQTPYDSFEMRRGRELEDAACYALQITLNKYQVRGKLRRCGFFMNDERTLGASPDRMLVINGREEPCEVKAPLAHTHMEYLLTDIGSPENKYYAQIQGQIWITCAKQGHFFSWHPAMPGRYICFPRDDAYIEKLKLQLHNFLAELKAAEAQARTLGGFIPYVEEQ